MWLKIFQTSGLKNLNQRSVAPWIINVDSSKFIQKGTRSMLPWKNEMLVCWEGVVVNVFIKLHHTCSWWTLVFINYNLKSFWIEYFIHAHYTWMSLLKNSDKTEQSQKRVFEHTCNRLSRFSWNPIFAFSINNSLILVYHEWYWSVQQSYFKNTFKVSILFYVI